MSEKWQHSPELWYSWKYQIPTLASDGFHVIAPDLRGYGETDKPEGIESYHSVPMSLHRWVK